MTLRVLSASSACRCAVCRSDACPVVEPSTPVVLTPPPGSAPCSSGRVCFFWQATSPRTRKPTSAACINLISGPLLVQTTSAGTAREVRAFYHNAARASSSGGEWRPGRLAQLAAVRAEPLLRPSVRRNGCERAAPVILRAIDQRDAIRRVARRLVLVRVRKHPKRACLQVHDSDAIVAAVQRDHRQLLAVGCHPGARVVAPGEGHALGPRALIGGHKVDLCAARPIGGEVDAPA